MKRLNSFLLEKFPSKNHWKLYLVKLRSMDRQHYKTKFCCRQFSEEVLHRCSCEKGVLKICSKFTGVISIKLLCMFIEIALRHECSPVNLLHTFRTHFPKNISEGLLLFFQKCTYYLVKHLWRSFLRKYLATFRS